MPLKARRYMTRFTCIAERCSDTCCRGLTIPLTARDARTLSATLTSPADRAQLEAAVDPNAAALRPRADGHCGFLDSERLCSLQRRFGAATLPEACALFPRVLTSAGGVLQLSGSLGCPEVARLLLEPDAMALDEADEAPLKDAPFAALDARAAALREAAGALVTDADRPLQERVTLLAFLAHELAVDEVPFEKLLEAFARKDVRDAFAERAQALRSSGALAASLAFSLLRAWQTAAHPPQAAFAREVLQRYGAGGGELDPSALVERATELEAALEAPERAALEHALTRMAEHALDRRPFSAEAAQRTVLELAAHLAIVRLWLLGAGPPVTPSPSTLLGTGFVEGRALALQLFAKYAAPRLGWEVLAPEDRSPQALLGATAVLSTS